MGPTSTRCNIIWTVGGKEGRYGGSEGGGKDGAHLSVSCAIKQCLILGREGVRSLTTLAIVTVIYHICVIQHNHQEDLQSLSFSTAGA